MEVKLEDLKTRFWTSLIVVIGLGILVFFSMHLIAQVILAMIFVGFLILAQWELYHLTLQKGFHGQKISYLAAPFYLATIVICAHDSYWSFLGPLVIGVIVGLLFLEHFFKIKNPISSISVSLLSIFYLIIPLSFLLKITLLTTTIGPSGRWWIYYLIAVTKAGDVGAYFIGKMIGRYYLAPRISPKKTYKGLLAGLIASTLVSFIFIYLSPQAKALMTPAWAYALILGVSLCFIGLIGDLSESLLKRDAQVKDSNKLKGFGGFLDMMDSLIFTAPCFYLFLLYGDFL